MQAHLLNLKFVSRIIKTDVVMDNNDTINNVLTISWRTRQINLTFVRSQEFKLGKC